MNKITKTDIVNQIWEQNNGVYTRKDIELIINSFVELIGDGLKNDLKVKIEGFGTFSTYLKKIKGVGNTQDEVINAKYISFKPSKKLK